MTELNENGENFTRPRFPPVTFVEKKYFESFV